MQSAATGSGLLHRRHERLAEVAHGVGDGGIGERAVRADDLVGFRDGDLWPDPGDFYVFKQGPELG